MASALCIRAEARKFQNKLEECIVDALQSTSIMAKSNAKAWRLLHETYEETKQYKLAIESLRNWARVDPFFSTKAMKEVDRIREDQSTRETNQIETIC